MELDLLLEKAQNRVHEKNLKLAEIERCKQDIAVFEVDRENCGKARALVQKVAEETQKKIEFQISNLVSLALASVFPDPYTFKVEFVQRRNRTECDFFFVKDGNSIEPISSSGGGAIDVAGFALRIAIWSLKKSHPIFILDESFRFVSVDLQEKCSQMLKELSDKLGIQIILISHLPNIINSADTAIKVEYNKKSNVH